MDSEPRPVLAAPSLDSLESARLRARLRHRLFRSAEAGVVLGRYELRRLLGSGGMGVVYEAYDPLLLRRVAVKLLSGVPCTLASRVLRREARALAALAHPHVVPVFEIGGLDARPFVAMELVDGEPLDRWLANDRSTGPRRFQQTLDLLLQAGRGLDAAHRVGIVHCDFKPSNVLVGRDGRVRVADFGLARLFASEVTSLGASPREVSTGASSSSGVSGGSGRALRGTPAYMAPEQLAGAEPDDRSDQFAFCMTAWESLFGERPARDELVTTAGPRLPRALGRGPEAAVARAVASQLRRGLAHDPHQRHPSMMALLVGLTPTRRSERRVMGLAAVATAGLAMVAAAWPGPRPQTEARRGDCDVWAHGRAASRHLASADPRPPSAEIEHALAQWDRRFERVWDQVCVAEEHAETAGALACLRARRAELDALRLALERGAPGTIDQLPDPEPCREASESGRAPRHDRARRLIERRLDAAEQARRRGDHAGADALGASAELLARRLGRPELLARAYFERGVLAHWRREGTVARRLLDEAYTLAVGHGDDDTAARAATHMLSALTLLDDAPGMVWSRHAHAAVRRVDDPWILGEHEDIRRRSNALAIAFPAHAADLAPDEAWVFDELHLGAPACDGHGCAHDFTVLRHDPPSDGWVANRPGTTGRAVTDHVGFGRPVRAVSAGEVIACWRGYPDHAWADEDPQDCACHSTTGASRCDIDPDLDPDDPWRACAEVVRKGGNILVVLDDEGRGINYVHLQAGSVPDHLCPNDLGRAVPLDSRSIHGFFPDEYLTTRDATGPRPRVAVGELIGRTGHTGRSAAPRVHLQGMRYQARANGNFDQLGLLEIVFEDGMFAAMSSPAPLEWRPLAGQRINDRFEALGPLVLRPPNTP